jgi:hypothetical protein
MHFDFDAFTRAHRSETLHFNRRGTVGIGLFFFLLLAGSRLAADVTTYGVIKSAYFEQTSASDPVRSRDAYVAYSYVLGTNLSGNYSFTLPTGTTQSLSGDTDREMEYSSDPFGTLTAFNAAYPNGTYQMTLPTAANPTRTVALPTLTGDGYPSPPKVTATAWSAGRLQADPNQDFTVTFAPFADAQTGASIGFSVENMVGRSVFGTTTGQANTTSFTIPRGTLVAGRIYRGELRFNQNNINFGDRPGALISGANGSSGYTAATVFNLAAIGVAPSFTSGPTSQTVTVGGSVSLTATAAGGAPLQWEQNGVALSGATASTLTLSSVQPANAGLYAAVISDAGGFTATNPAVVGVSSSAKVIGTGSEIAANIVHANGNVFDQVLIEGPALALSADPTQILRTSCIDLNDDIIQIEFSGAGTVSVVIANIAGPAVATKYNQPAVQYMKGHAGIVVTGADQTTNLSVFSVGRGNAVNQALFRDDVSYDGIADIGFIAISSTNGRFGGLRTANVRYLNDRGFAGVYAPGVNFEGPVFVGNVMAFDAATPVLIIGGGDNVQITGGDLAQPNFRAVQVAGISQLKMSAGSTSGRLTDAGTLLAAKAIRGRLEQGGVDVTTQIVLNP